MTKVIDRSGKATIYEYDAAGNRSAVRYPNGDVVTYTYDACQRLKEECTVNGSGKQLAKYSYGTGKAGERLSVTEVSGGETTEITYKYDKLNRLVKETTAKDGNKLTQEYSYDKNSNRTEKKVSVKGDVTKLADTGLDDVQVTEGTTKYTYNFLDQLLVERGPEGIVTYGYDVNGNLTAKIGRITFGWWSYPEYEHTDAVSPEDYPELWDGGYYVLTYSTWDTSIHMVVYLLGAVSAVLIGIFIFSLLGWLFRGKMGVSIISLAFGIGCCSNPCITPLGIYSFLYFGPLVAGLIILLLVFGVVFGIMGKKRNDHRIAVAGIICSSLEACLVIGGLLVYFLIAD